MALIETDIPNITFDDNLKTYYINLDYGYGVGGTKIIKTKMASSKQKAMKILWKFESTSLLSLIMTKTNTAEEWFQQKRNK